MAFPFVILKRSTVDGLKQDIAWKAQRIRSLGAVNKQLSEKLEEAQKNDYRDPKTGRFTKAKK